MATFSSFHSVIMALLAFFLASILVEAAPVANPEVPTFSIYAESNLKGGAKSISKYGCFNHGLKSVGSVKYQSGPKAQLKFYKGKDCKGKITHSMPDNTYKFMGGPYQTHSVLVYKGDGSTMQ
ncbi:hypothetical protein BGX29_005354 [Mortierella sp. GBA35]|nr:hypothetical protein BGX23_005730 [Mortierella sp. AD031]KAF9101683.1 hypothetical protein BGX29_005354 [Mortierella sp. GBA35]